MKRLLIQSVLLNLIPAVAFAGIDIAWKGPRHPPRAQWFQELAGQAVVQRLIWTRRAMNGNDWNDRRSARAMQPRPQAIWTIVGLSGLFLASWIPKDLSTFSRLTRTVRRLISDHRQPLRITPLGAGLLFLTGMFAASLGNRRGKISMEQEIQKREEIKRFLGRAFERHHLSTFEFWKKRFENLTHGRVLAFSLHDGDMWAGQPIMNESQFRHAAEDILALFPKELYYNRTLVSKIFDGLLATAATGPVAVALEWEQVPGTVGEKPVLRITLLSPRFPRAMLYPLSGADAATFPRQFTGNWGYAYDISLTTDLRPIPASQIPGDGDTIESLSGARSQTQRIYYAGDTAIRKIIPISKNGRSLFAEAARVAELGRLGIAVPEFFFAEVVDNDAVVIMQDLQLPPLSSLFLMDVAHTFSDEVIWAFVLKIMGDLVPVLYGKKATETPPDFVDRRIENIDQRLATAKGKAPILNSILEAPYMSIRSLERRLGPSVAEYVIGYSTLRPFLLALAKTGIFTPAYLSQEHGDLHFGNILFDPLDYARLGGNLSAYYLIDPNTPASFNDPLSDFAKLFRDTHGRLQLARHAWIYGFDPIATERHILSGELIDVPVLDQDLDLEDMFAIRLYERVEGLRHLALEWLKNADDFFGHDMGAAWEARLLFQEARAMIAGVANHLIGDHEERTARSMYILGVTLMGELLADVFNGTYGSLWLNRLEAGVLDSWKNVLDVRDRLHSNRK